MRNRYDMQLHLLDTQLTHMGELCETAIAKVTQALKEGNTEQAKIVIKEDEEIDQIEKDIETLSEASAPAAAGRKRPQKNLSST